MALRSEQARILRRRVLGRAGIQLAVFTLAVVLACVVFETFLKAPVADFVADATAPWHSLSATKEFAEELAAQGLANEEDARIAAETLVNDYLAIYGAQSGPAAESDGEEDVASDGGQDGAANATDLAVSAWVDEAPFLDYALTPEQEARVTELLSRVSYDDAGSMILPDGWPELTAGLGLEVSARYPLSGEDRARIILLARLYGMDQQGLDEALDTAFRTAQDRAYNEWVLMDAPAAAAFLGIDDDRPVWSVLQGDDGVYRIRDISTYSAIKSLKIPLLVFVLVTGWFVIGVAALNRSLRYFDDLSGAVAKLLSDKDSPVELPSDLSIARNELAVIRSQSLADERAARAAEQRKNELVAYLAHDIRTPLTSVIGYLDLLRESDGLAAQTRRKYADIAYAKAERLEDLINEFFEITRYNLSAIPIERETVDVRLFCEQVAESFYPEAMARRLAITVRAPRSMDFFVDPDKLARALGNVMRNAVAYAEEGSAIAMEARAEGAWAVITVANRGREISEAHLESIFEKFYREDGARSSRSGGAGLGLAIAKEIVVAHKGDIYATSEEGLTVFTMRLPLRASFQRKRRTPESQGPKGAPRRRNRS